MKKIKYILTISFFFTFILNFAQEVSSSKNKIKISGKLVEKISKQPLEYATITLKNSTDTKNFTGGITNVKGEFDIYVTPGIYNITIEFISFETIEIKNKNIQKNTNLGIISLEEDASQLKEVVVRAKKTIVEIKLDKKIYTVGQDMIVKGGTASDVLENVPSITIDSDGNVNLRGNDNVRIFIDGRPSNAINITDALKIISADALDKVEVITNPSARYDAEGGAGIINIVLKKGKNQGFNATLMTTVGNPKNYGFVANLNFKSENFNLFSTLGYNDSKVPGNYFTNSDYLNPDGSIQNTINERSFRERGRKGFNYNFGTDWYLDKTLTWTNAVTYRKNDGTNPDNVYLYNYQNGENFVRNRYNNQFTQTSDLEYTSTFIKKFKKEGHKLTIDALFSANTDDNFSIITDFVIGQESNVTKESVKNNQSQNRNLIQSDYTLPIGKNSLFEAGYKGDSNELLTDYSVGYLDIDGNYIPYLNFTNTFNYKEKINAIYSQFGSKIKKISYLLGLRYEDSNIDTNLLTTNEFNKKRYHNFFPSTFLTYQINDGNSLSLNYSKRIARPRSRLINPFSNYSSNINIFQGNPDLNPSFTDALDIGYIRKWTKITLSSSAYFNKTKNIFQFIKRPNGVIVTSIVNGETIESPVILITPINLSNENRYGFEFNANYSPYKWWRLNGNFNIFKSKITGNYSYTLINTGEMVMENFNKSTLGWFSRVSSKITFPYKIDWQTNVTYTAPQYNVQGKSLGYLVANMAFSKDFLKEKVILSLNATDLFNSNKIIREANLPNLNSYSEIQRKERQINLSFTYRFNKTKIDKEKQVKNEKGDGGDFSE